MNAIVRLNHAFDRAFDTPAGKAYKRARAVEAKFARQLRKVAQHVADLIAGFDLTDPNVYQAVQLQLEEYAKLLDPWARSVATRMITEVSSRDYQGWKEASARIGRNLRREIDDTPLGAVMQQLLNEQTALITSIPREAADRVRRVTLQGITEGKRPAAYIDDIMRTGHVTKSRATLIARTEVARTGSVLSQTRAQSIGCTHFIWRTVGDTDVRPGHKALNGKVFEYLNPPICDPPDHRALPGQIWNCFSGETQIALGYGVTAIYRSPFKGKVVDLVAGDATITATENHPMLTARGWVPARELHEGDYLVYAINDAKLIVDANRDRAKPTFGELFEAFGAAKHKAAAGREFHFYGDFPDGDVEEITFNRPLTDDVMALACERVRNGAFAHADGQVEFAADGVVDKVLHSDGASFPDQIAALAIAHAPHADKVRLAPGPNGDAASDKDAPDHIPGDLEPEGNRQLALASRVGRNDLVFGDRETVRGRAAFAVDLEAALSELEAKHVGIDANSEAGGFESGVVRYQFLRIRDLIVRDYFGHVFTLQTTKGIYGVGSASAIVKNCRCIAEPIIPEF